MKCPFCASTDIFDELDSSGRGCIDCDKRWERKQKKAKDKLDELVSRAIINPRKHIGPGRYLSDKELEEMTNLKSKDTENHRI